MEYCKGLMWSCAQVMAGIKNVISPSTAIRRLIVMNSALMKEVIAVIFSFFSFVRKILVMLESSTEPK